MQIIKTFDFISKLGDVYFVAYNTLNIMKRGNIQAHIVNTMTQGIDGLLLQFIVNADGTRIPEAEMNKGILKEIKQKYIDAVSQQVEGYEPIFLNQNLVMQCTIMEIFFLHILEVIVETKPETMKGLAQEKNISLEHIMSVNTYNAIIEKLKSKIFDHFSRQGIKDKFIIYEKVGLNTDRVFNFSSYTNDVQQRFKDYSVDSLIGIFDKRHNVVHKNELPIISLDEITLIKEFFEKIILNLSTLVMDKYGVLLDIQDNLIKSGYPREKIPVKQITKDSKNLNK